MSNKKKTTKQIAPQETEHALAATTPQTPWGAEGIDNEDIIIPRIMTMQPMSELVTDGVAKIGELRDSLDKTRVLGNDQSPAGIVIFKVFKTWVVFKDGDYQEQVPLDHSNATWSTEEICTDGAVITRDKVLNFYCLLEDDLKDGAAFPYLLSCRRTSFYAGKKLVTMIKKLEIFDKPSAGKLFHITTKKETNDKGTFFVLDAHSGRDTTNEELAMAYKWFRTLTDGKVNVKVDDEVETASKVTTPDRVVHAEADAPF